MTDYGAVLNPFYNLRRSAGMTLGEVSAHSRVDIRAITRSEYGMYTRPLPALVNYWVLRGAISEGILVSEYEFFQIAVRRCNRLLFGPDLSVDLQSNIHPLRQLRARKGFGLVELCKLLCLPLDTVQFFEKKWRTQQSVPKGLQLALNQAGYSRKQISEFCTAYKEWRANQRAVVFT